uniref:N-acetyltransferase domain-containing protein n=1 Tax=viral metagenome TaxID=1070528 RepID=A0A6H1ZCL9_9ZZZZ
MTTVHAEPCTLREIIAFVDVLRLEPAEAVRVTNYFDSMLAQGVRTRIVYCETEPIVITGALQLSPVVCQCWVHARPDAAKFGFTGSVTRMLRRLVLDLCKDFGYHRAQAIVTEAEGKVVMRWVEAIGFKFEGELKQFCPDKTSAYMYGLIP